MLINNRFLKKYTTYSLGLPMFNYLLNCIFMSKRHNVTFIRDDTHLF